MNRSAAAVLLWLTACGPKNAGAGASSPSPSNVMRLCVQNETVAYGNIIARAGTVRFDVMPGREVCKPVPGTGPMVELQATTSAGGVNGPISFSARLHAGLQRCWTWRLTESPGASYDLTPCEQTPARDSTGAAAP